MRVLLFVYGTLRPDADHEIARWLAGRCDVVGPATARGELLDLGRYPGYVAGASVVPGLLVRLHQAADLARLDAYEGVPGLFVRERRPVVGPEGPAEAWVYVYVGARPGTPVRDGVWRPRQDAGAVADRP